MYPKRCENIRIAFLYVLSICHVLINYIASFLQMNIHSDNLLQRQPRNSVAMTKMRTRGLEEGVGKKGEGCEREGCGSNLAATNLFSFFFLLLSLPTTPQKTNPSFLSTPNLL